MFSFLGLSTYQQKRLIIFVKLVHELIPGNDCVFFINNRRSYFYIFDDDKIICTAK